MGFFSSIGNYFGGPVGGMLGGGLDTTINNNKRSGHPSGGSAPTNLISGMISNSISSVKKDLKDFGLTSAVGAAITYKSNRDRQKQTIANNNRNATIVAENASRPVVTKQEVDFEGTVKSARAAGFNPLTALRATGGNITTTNTRFVAPLLSSMPSVNFTNIMSDAFSGYQSFQKGRTQKLQFGLETDLLKSEIAKNLMDLDPFAMPKINLGAMYKDPVTGKIFKSLNLQAFEGSRSEIMSSGSIHLGFAGAGELYDWIKQLGGSVVNKQPITSVGADWKNSSNTSAINPDHLLKPFHERVRDNYKREKIPIPLIIDRFLKPSAQ